MRLFLTFASALTFGAAAALACWLAPYVFALVWLVVW